MSIIQAILLEVSFTSLNHRAGSLLIKTAVGGMGVVMSYSCSVDMRTDQMMIEKT